MDCTAGSTEVWDEQPMRVPVNGLFDPAIIAAGSPIYPSTMPPNMRPFSISQDAFAGWSQPQLQQLAQMQQPLPPNLMNPMRQQPFYPDMSAFSIYKGPVAPLAGVMMNPWLWQMGQMAQMDPTMMAGAMPPWMHGGLPMIPGITMPSLQGMGSMQGLPPALQPRQGLMLSEGLAAPAISSSTGAFPAEPATQHSGSPTAQAKRRTARTRGGAGKRVVDGFEIPCSTGAPPPQIAEQTSTHTQGVAALGEIRRDGAKSQVSLKDVLPAVAELARDVEGSKYLQAKLDIANAEDREAVFEALLPEAATHASDANGCTVVQKLLDIGTLEQRKALAQRLQGEVLKLSNKMYGCRVVQKAFQVCSPDVQLLLASELKKGVIDCIKSMHGNHVVQKCIEQMPPDSVAFVVEAIEDRAESMASHIYGCRIIQRLLEHCAPQRLDTMLQHILKGAFRLSQDPYGNYVVRHILEHGRKEHKRQIIEMVYKNVLELGRDKCASNVVEKCFEATTVGEHASFFQNERRLLYRSMLEEVEDGLTPLQNLVEDRFGKYVVQCMAEHCRTDEERTQMRVQVEAFAPKKRGSSNGTNVLLSLSKDMGIIRISA